MEKVRTILNNRSVENWLFMGLLLITLFPIFSVKHFVSHDGAAHLYNANILIDLLFKKEYYPLFFELNTEPEPNLIGHALYIITRLVLNPIWAEKTILIITISSLVFSFRYFIKNLIQKPSSFYLIIFFFVYNYIFVLGFLNFCISISVLFFVCGWYYKHRDEISKKELILLLLLCAILYFSHIFSYLIWLIFGFTTVVQDLINKTKLNLVLKKIEVLFWTNLVPVLFIINYFTKKESTEILYWTIKEKIKYLAELKSIINFNPNEFQLYFTVLKICFTGAFIVLIFNIIKKHKEFKQFIWLLILLVFVGILYLIMPNTSSGGGYISDRFALYIILFTIVVFSTINWPKIISVFFNALLILSLLGFIFKITPIYKEMDKKVDQLLVCEEKIKEGSIILPVVFQNDWLFGHVSNYIASNRKLVLLENYEASQGYFPVLWKEEVLPIVNLPLIFNQQTDLDFTGYYSRSHLKVNYVLLWDNIKHINNPKYSALLNTLNNQYSLVYSNEDESVRLFEIIK